MSVWRQNLDLVVAVAAIIVDVLFCCCWDRGEKCCCCCYCRKLLLLMVNVMCVSFGLHSLIRMFRGKEKKREPAVPFPHLCECQDPFRKKEMWYWSVWATCNAKNVTEKLYFQFWVNYSKGRSFFGLFRSRKCYPNSLSTEIIKFYE